MSRTEIYLSASGSKPATNSLINPARPVFGLEAEFHVVCDGCERQPEVLFGAIDAVFPKGPVPWRGKPLALPYGGVVYFDRGVIEVVTPPFELSQSAARDATICLWHQIFWVRRQLNRWSARMGRKLTLRAYSTHYNISFDVSRRNRNRDLNKLAYLLCYVIPFPLTLIAMNVISTGIGARARTNRLEVTADFTANLEDTIAAASIVIGTVSAIMLWHEYSLTKLAELSIPRLSDFEPVKHRSRTGWLAHQSCYPTNPFIPLVGDERWRTVDNEPLTMGEISACVIEAFWSSIVRFSDAPTSQRIVASIHSQLIQRLVRRPPESYYDFNGLQHRRPALWNSGQYAGVLARCHRQWSLLLGSMLLEPHEMLGWFLVRFVERLSGRSILLTLDEVLASGGVWRRPVSSASDWLIV